MNAQERAELEKKIPGFNDDPAYVYLAEKHALSEQNDVPSFKNPPWYTKLRRDIYGLTDAEERLVEKQNRLLVPFQQEQKIIRETQAKLKALAPTLQQFIGSQGGMPADFLEPNQQSPLTPTALNVFGEEEPLGVTEQGFMPQARLSPAQMTIAAPLMEQKAVLTRGGGILPTSLVPEQKAPSVKEDILDIGGVPYQVRAGEGGQKILTPMKGFEPKTEKPDKLVNPVDQRVAVLSQGKYRTLNAALDAGQYTLAAKAEDDVRVARLVQVAEASAGAKEEVKGKFEVRQKLADLANVEVIVDTLSGLADRLITAENGPDAILQAAQLSAGSATSTNEVAKAYDDSKQAFIGVLSRQLGGERGVLTDRDINRIVTSLPRFNDTKTVKDFKVSTIRLIIATAIDAKKRSLSGEKADPKLKAQLQKMFEQLDKGSSGGVASFNDPEEEKAYQEWKKKQK